MSKKKNYDHVQGNNMIGRDKTFPIINGILLVLVMFVTLYPVLNTIAYSFNDGTDALRGNIGLWPRKFSLGAYESILSDKLVYQAAWISASKTVLITLLNLFWTSMLAYTLSRPEFVLRKFITTVMVLTMYINAGLNKADEFFIACHCTARLLWKCGKPKRQR